MISSDMLQLLDEKARPSAHLSFQTSSSALQLIPEAAKRLCASSCRNFTMYVDVCQHCEGAICYLGSLEKIAIEAKFLIRVLIHLLECLSLPLEISLK
jgi:hypothetical protein